MCQVSHIPLPVEATAIVYFQRFYLRTSGQPPPATPINPRHVVLAVIYLAAKVEEWKTGQLHQLLRALSQIGALEEKTIVQTELLVLQAMSFHITVFHPFQCHRALVREISQTHKWRGGLSQEKQRSVRDVLNSGGSNKPFLSFLERRSLQLLKRSYMTDACFLYSPAQLALAAVIAACHMPGSAGITCPNDEIVSAIKSDIGLFAEAYFRKFQEYEVLLQAVQSAAALMILPLRVGVK